MRTIPLLNGGGTLDTGVTTSTTSTTLRPTLAPTAKTEDVGHYRTPFSRIHHLMPIRQRLAKSLFTVATIRSDAGREALEDLIKLYQSEFEVEHRPGLGPENCHCQDPKAYVPRFYSRPKQRC